MTDTQTTLSSRTKQLESKYPGWDGPFFTPHLDALQLALDAMKPSRQELNIAAEKLGAFKLISSSESRPETESAPGEIRVWRVAYPFVMPDGGEAAIFIPNECGKLHAAIYTRHRQTADLRELDRLAEAFRTSLGG